MAASRFAVVRGARPRGSKMIMAASAAMIIAGIMIVPQARAQDAAASDGGSVVLLNQIESLKSQMRQMQGEIEVLQHQLQQSQQVSKDQYVDLDSRIGKLEQAEHAGAAAAPSTAAPSASAPASAAVAAPGKAGSPSTPAPAKPATAADKAAAEAAYDAAFKTLRSGNYVESARSFRAFIDKYPDSSLVSNAYYWLGGSYYVTQNYQPALDAFQTLLTKYPGSSKAPDAQLRAADCLIGLKKFPAARITLQAVIKAHPGTPLEKRARERLRDLPPAASGK